MKSMLAIIFIILLGWGLFTLFKKDTYIGFYYPDANNLLNDVQSEGTFKSLEQCRDWINEQILTNNPSGTGYDYECGKNCDTSDGKPYICEETLE